MHHSSIIEFQHGDKEACKLIFNMLYPVMCSFARKYIGSDEDSEDIAQEIFIELWHQHAKFESLNQIKAFLYLSVKNKCLNFRKHQIVKDKYSDSFQSDIEQSFDEYIIEAEVIQNLNTLIESLPEQRKQIILQSMQGLSNNEIAENMSISINTVKLHKKIAYRQLRDKLGSSPFILSLLF